MISINILTFSIECVLLLLYTSRLSDGVICYQTDGANLTTCEISPEREPQFCSIVCELKISGFHCVSECVNALLCHHNVTTAVSVTFCCKTSFCNGFDTIIPIIPTTNGTVTTTRPTTTSNDDAATDDNITHVIIAVCLGVAFILAVMSLVIVLIICHWRRWSRNQLRWKNTIN